MWYDDVKHLDLDQDGCHSAHNSFNEFKYIKFKVIRYRLIYIPT